MTMRALVTTLDPVDPAVRSDAKSLAERLHGDTPVESAVRSMLDDVAHGARIVVLRTDDELTPSQAAELMGVTRQFVDRLCADGVLAYRRLPGSRHRRIRVQDVINEIAERDQIRRGAAAIREALGNP
ncbi:helix-turn-helix domain-containing protein [Microbacterium sp.]|uniref:helix-turn-helix domain-containing protein n=1 Tax=Microbacterium sp. TaxID=51671 RepID=UPI0039E4DFF2